MRQRRLRGDAYFAFVDQFVEAVKARYPRAVIQWEDLAKDAAFAVLERYRKVLPSFNDDIQGTGAVALAGLHQRVRAARRAAARSARRRLRRRRRRLRRRAGRSARAWCATGSSEDEARARVFVIDSKGLLTTDRSMEPYKKRVRAGSGAHRAAGRSRAACRRCSRRSRTRKPTALLGLSGQPRAFTEPVVRAMAAANAEARPIIFPLSNPTSSCEALPEELLEWTDGRAHRRDRQPVRAGARTTARRYTIGQGNNAFIFPGLGFGAILVRGARDHRRHGAGGGVRARRLHRGEVPAARAHVYPPVDELNEVSMRVATRVIEQAFDDGVAQTEKVKREGAAEYVRARFWKPRYLPIVRG